MDRSKELKWYKAITQSETLDNEDSFIVCGTSLFNAYRNSIAILNSVKAKLNTDRILVKVIPAPHLDAYHLNLRK